MCQYRNTATLSGASLQLSVSFVSVSERISPLSRQFSTSLSPVRLYLDLATVSMRLRCSPDAWWEMQLGRKPVRLCKLFSLFVLQLESEQMNKSSRLWIRVYEAVSSVCVCARVCVCVCCERESTYSMIRESPSKHRPDVAGSGEDER